MLDQEERQRWFRSYLDRVNIRAAGNSLLANTNSSLHLRTRNIRNASLSLSSLSSFSHFAVCEVSRQDEETP